MGKSSALVSMGASCGRFSPAWPRRVGRATPKARLSLGEIAVAVALSCAYFPARFANVAKPRAALAQPVEHVIRNDGVACSSHAGGTTGPRAGPRPPSVIQTE